MAQRQLFFLGGAPRSGTTWLQQMLDAHPEISCRGEGLFLHHLAVPLDALLQQRRQIIGAKNATLFGHTGGYPLPDADDADFLLGVAILRALCGQPKAANCRAVGEKTPENAFFFARLHRIFPAAKFIAIFRDPRDVLASAWHFFHPAAPGEDSETAKRAFVRNALPSLNDGARHALAFGAEQPELYRAVTYENLLRAPQAEMAALLRFLGLPTEDAMIADCVARHGFAAQTGGRAPGSVQNGAFLRAGIAGSWAETLSPAINDMILAELGWMFPIFGWKP